MSASFPLAKLTFLIIILTAVGQMTQTIRAFYRSYVG